MNPKVSIVLPVYNAQAYLKEAVDSLLNQTFANFELLVLNDGSSDDSCKIIQSYTDQRIINHKFEKNVGLIKVLNHGFKMARGEYIVRMDADDISVNDRIEKQVRFMDQNPEVGVCGTQLQLLGAEGSVERPCADEELRWWIFKSSPMAHPSVIIRNEVLKANHLQFDLNAYVAEDFDLWWKMAFHCKLANLPEKLLHYRVHPNQESSSKTEIQSQNHRRSLLAFMERLGIDSNAFSPQFVVDMLGRDLFLSSSALSQSWSFFNVLETSGAARNFFGYESLQRKRNEIISYQVSNLKSFDLKTLGLLKDKAFFNVLRRSEIGISSWIVKSLIHWKTR